jgi:molybdenum cofactor cytidylyltransferase
LDTIDCVLLGAGSSSRMKEDKLLLTVGDRTIFEISLAEYLRSSLHSTCAVVAGWLEGFGPVMSRYRHPGVSFIEVEKPCPMSDSLKSGWRWVQHNLKPRAVMISLADKPLISTRTIDSLIRAYSSSDKDICVPVFAGKRGHPVIICSRLGDEIMAIEGDQGARDLLASDPDRVEEVVVESDEILVDIDTLDDMDRLQSRLG